MTLIASAGLIFLLITDLYFLRLMSDAGRLERAPLGRPSQRSEAWESQGLLIPSDYSAWQAVPSSSGEDRDDEDGAQFFPDEAAALRAAKGLGRLVIPDTDGIS